MCLPTDQCCEVITVGAVWQLLGIVNSVVMHKNRSRQKWTDVL
jgi:hypothetical protein